MADIPEVLSSSPVELLASGRRHLAVRDYNAAASTLAKACELLAAEHGDTGDQCAEAYLWYGKALLGLSREESGVLGDGMPGTGNADDDDDEDDNEQEDIGEEEGIGEAENIDTDIKSDVVTTEAESTTKEEPGSSSTITASGDADKPNTSNGEGHEESAVDLDNEDDVDNLQLAWEMLELSRNILRKRCDNGVAAARALLAEAHLALGEVALESETYDKAVAEMQSCLEIQKELYGNDDRRIAEAHYQIGLANSLASNFEDSITHFKNAANILETRIKILQNSSSSADANSDVLYTIEGEIKELKELLPEIQEKIQDTIDCKAETLKRVREALCPSNGGEVTNGAGPSGSSESKPVSNISHLIKRKRKASDSEAESPAKKANT